MRCFYNLFEDSDVLLSDELKEIRHDVIHLSEIFARLNRMNLQFQGNFIKAKSVISMFISKLSIQT